MPQQVCISSEKVRIILWLDLGAPYEREMLLEHARGAAVRFGPVTVRIDRQEWKVAPRIVDNEPCAACSGQIDQIVFARAGYLLCSRCGYAGWIHNEDPVTALMTPERKPALRKEREPAPKPVLVPRRAISSKLSTSPAQRARA